MTYKVAASKEHFLLVFAPGFLYFPSGRRSIIHTVRRIGSPAIFLVVAASVYAAAFYVRSILTTVDSPAVVAGALAFDLVVFVPGAYYFLVVRRFGLPVISVAVVFVLSLIVANQIIPSEHQRVLTPLGIIAAAAELSVLGFIVWKAVLGIRRFRTVTAQQHDEDAFIAMRTAAGQVVDSERVANALAYEASIMYYGLGSWRQHLDPGAGRYTSYKLNNYGSTLFGISVLLVVELIAVHLIVQHYWSMTGALILSILSAYIGIWLLGDWQAHRLRPTLVTNGALVLRAGMRWEVKIPLARIQSFRQLSAVEEKPHGALNLVTFGDAHFEVTTNAPVEARGAYGISKSTECIWFTIDDPVEFQERLSSQLPGERSAT